MNVISNPEDQKTIKEHLNEAVKLMIMAESTKEQLNDIFTDLQDNFKKGYGVTKPIARKAAMILFKQNQNELAELADDVDTLVEIASAD